MPITFTDRAPIEKVRRLADGRIAAVCKFARSGCQTYRGSELGRPNLATVTVYRPEEEVFAADAMASFAHKAITLNHPASAVTSGNWSKVAVGFTEGRVARDGAYLEIPLMLADASAVAAYDAGTKELSAGYSCDLIWGDGVAPDGTKFQAKQVTIRGDHIALVAQGRAGPEARIGDAARKADVPPKSIDEALRQTFAAMAKNQSTTVEQLLSGMEQKKLEELAADVARQFVSSVAGAGVAGHFKDAASLTAAGNAAVGRLKVDIARRQWLADKANAHRASPPSAKQSIEVADQQVAALGGGGLEQARKARLARLSNAYRG